MFFDKLETMCNLHNIKITPLLKKLNISTGGISRWKSGVLPSGDTLIKIANYFDCSIDYLLDRTNDYSLNSDKKTTITEHEYQLLNAYRKNVNMQTAVDKLLGIDTNVVEVLKIARGKNSEPVRFKSDISDLKNAHMSDEDL